MTQGVERLNGPEGNFTPGVIVLLSGDFGKWKVASPRVRTAAGEVAPRTFEEVE
jgi:hypothetical protein